MKRSMVFSFALAFILSFSAIKTQAYVCGDINNDPQQKVTIADVVYLVQFLFANGPAIPAPIDRANLNCSQNPVATVTDLVFLVNYCMNGGLSPCANCADGVTVGDINLNGTPNEITDGLLFATYFKYGLNAFTIDQQAQLLTTDINGDGAPHTLSDLVLQQRVIVGELQLPVDSLPAALHTVYRVFDHKVSIDQPVAAAFLKIVEWHNTPSLLATNMQMLFHGDPDTAMILIYTNPTTGVIETFVSDFLGGVDGTIVYAEFATREGGKVIAERTNIPSYPVPYRVRIETTHNSELGEHALVAVTLEAAIEPITGFNFLISYNTPYITLSGIQSGPSFYNSGCGWEYFTYSRTSFGTCVDDPQYNVLCWTDKIRVIGIADINNGNQHPSCYLPQQFPATLFTIDFLVSDNENYECQHVPVWFTWFDCHDNTLSNQAGDTSFISRSVSAQYYFDNVTDSSGSFPSFRGAQMCGNTAPNLSRYIDFYSGGVDIICNDIIDDRGDINLNEIANEISDAVLFSNYFLYGLSVFHVNEQGQISATDVNADGVTLGVADLVYLCGVVKGDFSPFPNPVAGPIPSIDAIYTVAGGQISIDSAVAAAWIVVEGEVTPTLLAANVDMGYNFDGVNTNILIMKAFSPEPGFPTFNGPFVSVSGNVLSAEFGTAFGGVVNATRVDGK